MLPFLYFYLVCWLTRIKLRIEDWKLRIEDEGNWTWALWGRPWFVGKERGSWRFGTPSIQSIMRIQKIMCEQNRQIAQDYIVPYHVIRMPRIRSREHVLPPLDAPYDLFSGSTWENCIGECPKAYRPYDPFDFNLRSLFTNNSMKEFSLIEMDFKELEMDILRSMAVPKEFYEGPPFPGYSAMDTRHTLSMHKLMADLGL